MANPFDTIEALFDNPLSKLGGRASKTPELTPEEEASILENALGATLSGVRWAGESLDKAFGGRTIRGTMTDGADWGDLAHLIPFSDTLGLTDRGILGENLLANKSAVATGEELAARAGLATGNPWVDIPVGIGTEIVLDPGTLITGPGKALTKAAGVSSKAAGRIMGATPLAMSKEIAAGERGLLGLKLPFAEHPFATFGKGETAAKAYEALAYSAPARGMRQLFSADVRGQVDEYAQRFHHNRINLENELVGTATDAAIRAMKAEGELTGMWDSQLKNFVESNPEIVQKLTNGEPIEGMTADWFKRALMEYKDGNTRGTLAGLVGDAAKQGDLSKAIAAFDDWADNARKAIDSYAGRARMAGVALGELDDEFAAYFPRRISAMLRQAMPKKQADSMAAGVWANIHRSIRHVPGGSWVAHQMSLDPDIINAFDNGFTVEGVAEYMASRYQIPRVLELKDADGALVVPANLSNAVDPPNNITTGMKKSLRTLGHSLEDIDKMHPHKAWDLINQARTGDPLTIDPAMELAKVYTSLPKQVLEEGLYSRGTMIDLLDYQKTLGRRIAGVESMQEFLAKTASDTEDLGVPVSAIFHELGVTKQGSSYLKQLKGLPEDFDISKLTVTPSGADIARSYVRWTVNDKAATGVMKLYDKFLALFKGSQYGPWPGSHVRDLLGGLSQNMLTVFKGPKVAAAALADTWKAVTGRGAKYLDEALLHGFHDNPLAAELAGKVAKEGPLGEGKAPGLLDFLTPFRPANLKQGSLNPTSRYFWSNENRFNPLNFRGAREGLEDRNTFVFAEAGEKASLLTNFVNRYSAYAALRESGYEPSAAAQMARLIHFDQAALSETERKVFRRLIAFYRFARHNLVNQVRQIIDRPGGRTAQFLRTSRATQEHSREEGGYVPQYLKSSLAIPLGKQPTGEQRFFTSKALVPVEEAFNRFVFTGGVPDAERTLMQFAAMLTPPIQAPLQHISGKQFWSGRNIKDLHQSPLDDMPAANMVIGSLPFSRLGSEVRKLTDQRKSWPAAIANVMVGGQRITDVDVEKWKRLDAQKALTEELRPYGGIGEFTRLFVKDPQSLPPEILMKAAALDAVIEKGRKAKKQKQAAN